MRLENINEMRKRHEQEIKTLQTDCKHAKLSGWIEQWWALGHSTGSIVKVCEFCGKIIKKKKMKFEYVKIKNKKIS